MIEWLWALFAISWLALEIRAALRHGKRHSRTEPHAAEPIAGSITPSSAPQRQAS